MKITNSLAPDRKLAESLFSILAKETAGEVGICRDSYGKGEQFAHDLLTEAAKEIGLESEVDFAGNLYLTLPGRDRTAPATIIGSHIDSVPSGGNFDGAAGVIGGVSILSGLQKGGTVPATDLVVMAIRAEETPWFPYSFIGSRAALGTLPPEVVTGVRRTDTGKTLAEHMRELGFEPDKVIAGARHINRENIDRFYEIHIEQGPVLAEQDKPIGIVSGIQGSTRCRQARVFGDYGHSGGVPRKYRRDAVAGFIEFSHQVLREWDLIDDEREQAVITFCTVNTDPVRSSMNRISGEVRFALDIRSLSANVLGRMDDVIARSVELAEQKFNVKFDLGPRTGTQPSICDEKSRQLMRKAASKLGIPALEMPSGGGHDVQAFIDAGIPGAMLFVRNENGSHNPHESMDLEDLDIACTVLMHALADDQKI